MTRRLKLHPHAAADLAEIWTFTSQGWSIAQAERYLRQMNDALIVLRDQPELARRYGKSTPPVRIHRFRSHLLIFTEDDAAIEVIRIVHARSNWQALLVE